jgi:hypothetical protein
VDEGHVDGDGDEVLKAVALSDPEVDDEAHPDAL